SLLRVLAPATKGGRPWPLYPIAGAEAYAAGRAADVSGITVLGDSSIAFTLTEPLAIFPKFLAMPVASVVPAPPPGDLTQGPVGTGPWRFVAWQHDDYLLFARNPSYWGGAPAGDQPCREPAGDPRHGVRRSWRARAWRHPAGARRERHHAAGVRVRPGGGALAPSRGGVFGRNRCAAVAHGDERGIVAGGTGDPGAAGGGRGASGAGRAGG